MTKPRYNYRTCTITDDGADSNDLKFTVIVSKRFRETHDTCNYHAHVQDANGHIITTASGTSPETALEIATQILKETRKREW